MTPVLRLDCDPSSIVYPIVTYNKNWSTLHGIFLLAPLFYHIDRVIGYNIGGINASGQVNHNHTGMDCRYWMASLEGPFSRKPWSHRLGHPERDVYKEVTQRRVGYDSRVFWWVQSRWAVLLPRRWPLLASGGLALLGKVLTPPQFPGWFMFYLRKQIISNGTIQKHLRPLEELWWSLSRRN
jgi:hypothetical protein